MYETLIFVGGMFAGAAFVITYAAFLHVLGEQHAPADVEGLK